MWGVIAVDVEGILMVQQRQCNDSKAYSLCLSPCFICLRLPPPLCGEASSLEESRRLTFTVGPRHKGFYLLLRYFEWLVDHLHVEKREETV